MRLWFLVACVFALISCSVPPDASKLTCAPIDGVEQVLAAPGVFIGDMHGSEESPAFLSGLSCHVAKSGRPLIVAMEYDSADQVELLAYDLRGMTTSQQRDTASAGYISGRRAKRDADAFWIVFGGNVHARKTKGLNMVGAPAGYADHEPLGYQIRDWNLIHLNAYYRGGASWGCVGGPDAANCSVRPLSGPSCAADCPPHPAIRSQRSDPAYDGYYDVGKLTPSPPLFRQRPQSQAGPF